jgi:hypothetical protein
MQRSIIPSGNNTSESFGKRSETRGTSMNKRERQIQENANIRYFTNNGTERIVFDKISITTTHTDEHDWTIFKICKELKSQGYKFATECSKEINGKTRRADVVDFTRGLIIEVAVSEDKTSLDEKKQDWSQIGFEYMAIFPRRPPRLPLFEPDAISDKGHGDKD